MARYYPQKDPTDQLNDSFESGDEKEDATEEAIESNFMSYRPYVESCVRVIDLIVYFKLFTSDQTKMFHRTSTLDPVAATRLAFDAIVEITKPDKFHILIKALEEAEYPKIVKLLKGALIRVHDKHRQKLKEFAKDIFERVSICDILPYLLMKRVFTQNDVDELRAAERHDSRGSAAMQLLSALPNRNEDWFELFLSSLLETKQRELAVIIDKETTENLEAAAVLGIQSPIGESSLQVSFKQYKEQSTRREGLSETEATKEGFYKKLGSLKDHVAKADEQKGIGESSLLLSQEVGLRSLESETEGSIEENSITKCKPCTLKGCAVAATYWCVDCDEQICEVCEEVHRRLGLTKTHTVSPLKEVLSRDNAQLESRIYCFCCECHKADVYCENDNEVVCSECCQTSHKKCATLPLGKLNNHVTAKLTTAISEKAKSVISLLSNIEASRRKDRSKLQRTKDVCWGHVLLFHNELKNYLDDLKQEALKDLSNQEAVQKMDIDSCINDCDFIRQTINTEVKSLPLITNEDSHTVFMKYIHISKILKEAGEKIDAMQKKRYFQPIHFERKFTLETFRSEITSLGKSTSETGGYVKGRTLNQ